MPRCKMLIGISTAAIVAVASTVPAIAQTSTNTSTGNCTALAPNSPGGSCAIDNNAAGNDRNDAVVVQSGEGNFSRIVQRGDDNTGVIRQDGEVNSSILRQTGNGHFAENEQTGTLNSSEVRQFNDRNSATVRQTGQRNSSLIDQGTGTIPNSGSGNLLSVSQNGTNLDSEVVQAYFEASILMIPSAGPADDNSATVTQTGSGSRSFLGQTSRGSVAHVSMGQGGTTAARSRNDSSVIQVNEFYTTDSATGALVVRGPGQGPAPANNPRADNLADVAVFGTQNDSAVVQDGVLNRAEVSMLGGGSHNFGEPQANPNDPVIGPSGQPLPTNAKRGNSSLIRQMGRGNRGAVSLGGGGGRGNRSRIFQGGLSLNFTNYTEADLGRDHTAFVWQRGVLDTSDIRQDNNKRGFNGVVQTASFADISQNSLNSTAYVEQLGTNSATVSQGTGAGSGDNSLRLRQNDAGDETPITVAPEPVPVLTARNIAAVSQTGIGNGITIDQNARDATAVVWQQIGSRANTVEIEQGTGGQTAGENNAHDGTAVGSQGGYLAATVPADAADIGLGALNLTADVTQSRGSSRSRIRQDGQNLQALIIQVGIPDDQAVVAIATPNFAGISQINAWNSATVTQDGFSHTATVDQRGTGTGVRPNLVVIQQTGNSHRALARQLVAVAPSAAGDPAAGPAPGDPAAASFRFARPEGVNSAEIQIIQRGSFNDAFVEQQGKGQFGRIEQEGSNNNAGILQGPAAANAVAVIEQFGHNNDFFIEQTAAGQYQQIRQTGNDNIVSNLIGGSGGGTGTTAPPAFFPF